ncbi:SAYSvFN domain-containing protein 1 [Pseudophryne corroboree]|uniref:SAYSvFN domain-containing protein 1 n=1 Tax=Pseudophryne corroboree TaxID=495146 RepID=UPI003081B0CE
MDPLEQRLAEFRARKAKAQQAHGESSHGESRAGTEHRRKTFTQAAKETMQSVYSMWKTQDAPEPRIMDPKMEALASTSSVPEEDLADIDVQPPDSSVRRITLLLKFLLWLVLLGLFVELEFGLAYFILSMFYWLYEGTRGPRQRRKGEKSAYSVFNPGCEAIQGTLTAEQFERELQYRPLAGT